MGVSDMIFRAGFQGPTKGKQEVRAQHGKRAAVESPGELGPVQAG
jgi:hypothetical protein